MANDAETADQTRTTYFIGSYRGCVKIGFSSDLDGRLSDLQHASPEPLFVLATAPGGRETEAAYHKKFAEYRSHGEWFDRHETLRAEMDRLNPDLHLLLDWSDDDY